MQRGLLTLVALAISLLAGLLLIVVWHAQASGDGKNAGWDVRDVAPATVELPEGERVGLMLIKTGQWLIKPQYNDLQMMDWPDRLEVEQGGKWGLIDRDGKVVVTPQYDELGYCSDKGLMVKIGDKWGLIDRDGKVVVTAQYDEIGYCSDKGLMVKIGDKWGLIDQGGKVVLAPQYDDLNYYGETLLKVKIGDKWGLLDWDGKVVLAPQFDELYDDFQEGFAVVAEHGRYGYIDTAGRLVIAPQYEDARNFSEGLATVVIGGKRGYIDASGRMVIAAVYDKDMEPVYDDAPGVNFEDGLAAVKVNGKWGFVDKTGRMVIAPQFKLAKEFQGGLAPVVSGCYWGLVDKTGKMVVAPQFDEIDGGPPWVGIIDVDSYRVKCGFIDRTGKLMTPMFDGCDYFSQGLARVKVDGKWGFIDPTGKMVIPAKFTHVGGMAFDKDGLIRVEEGDKKGIIDTTGQWVAVGEGNYYPRLGILNNEGYFYDKDGRKLPHYMNFMQDGYKHLKAGDYRAAAGDFQAALKVNAQDEAALYGLKQAGAQGHFTP